MKVRMRTRYASASRNVAPGMIANVPDAEAKTLVDGGYAEYVKASAVRQVVITSPAVDEWRLISVNGIELDASVLRSLHKHRPPLRTIGDVVDFMADHELIDINGIGAHTAEIIATAIDRIRHADTES